MFLFILHVLSLFGTKNNRYRIPVFCFKHFSFIYVNRCNHWYFHLFYFFSMVRKSNLLLSLTFKKSKKAPHLTHLSYHTSPHLSKAKETYYMLFVSYILFSRLLLYLHRRFKFSSNIVQQISDHFAKRQYEFSFRSGRFLNRLSDSACAFKIISV